MEMKDVRGDVALALPSAVQYKPYRNLRTDLSSLLGRTRADGYMVMADGLRLHEQKTSSNIYHAFALE